MCDDGDVARFYADLVGCSKKEKYPDCPKGKGKEKEEQEGKGKEKEQEEREKKGKKEETEEPQQLLPNYTFCEPCQFHIPPDHQATHSYSAAHFMNLFSQAPSPPPFYGISECNKGYKLLKKIGWTEEKGLGKNRDGPLGPLKTQLKRDRRGLGAGKKLPKRVTHFVAYHPELEKEGYSTSCPLKKVEEGTKKKRKRGKGRAHERRIKALIRERDEELRRYLCR